MVMVMVMTTMMMMMMRVCALKEGKIYDGM